MLEIAMDPEVYRLVALVILFLFFTVAVASLGPDVAIPSHSTTDEQRTTSLSASEGRQPDD